jgi:hypothetical protein
MMQNWGLGALGGGFPAARQRFEEQYHCYSVAFAEKPHLEVRTVTVSYTMELWSYGVVLVQCGTVQVPFVPDVVSVKHAQSFSQ